jgi:catechol 2,3-dioxygenase-like lactoylglutathione lyase family enzyme
MIDHIMINANEYEKELGFYSWLMPKLGYGEKMVHDRPERRSAGFRSKSGGVWLTEPEGSFRGDKFDKRRSGIREIAFLLESKQQMDEIADQVEKQGGKVLEMPHQNSRGDYQFFFQDPEGIKLEIVIRKG